MKVNNLQSEMQSLAKELQKTPSNDFNTGRIPALEQNNQNFSDILADALNNVNQLKNEGNELRTRFDMGDHSVSIGDVMIANQKASVAFDATVEVRNKLVEAYKDIMSMTV